MTYCFYNFPHSCVDSNDPNCSNRALMAEMAVIAQMAILAIPYEL